MPGAVNWLSGSVNRLRLNERPHRATSPPRSSLSAFVRAVLRARRDVSVTSIRSQPRASWSGAPSGGRRRCRRPRPQSSGRGRRPRRARAACRCRRRRARRRRRQPPKSESSPSPPETVSSPLVTVQRVAAVSAGEVVVAPSRPRCGRRRSPPRRRSLPSTAVGEVAAVAGLDAVVSRARPDEVGAVARVDGVVALERVDLVRPYACRAACRLPACR